MRDPRAASEQPGPRRRVSSRLYSRVRDRAGRWWPAAGGVSHVDEAGLAPLPRRRGSRTRRRPRNSPVLGFDSGADQRDGRSHSATGESRRAPTGRATRPRLADLQRLLPKGAGRPPWWCRAPRRRRPWPDRTPAAQGLGIDPQFSSPTRLKHPQAAPGPPGHPKHQPDRTPPQLIRALPGCGHDPSSFLGINTSTIHGIIHTWDNPSSVITYRSFQIKGIHRELNTPAVVARSRRFRLSVRAPLRPPLRPGAVPVFHGLFHASRPCPPRSPAIRRKRWFPLCGAARPAVPEPWCARRRPSPSVPRPASQRRARPRAAHAHGD